jgi:hypothetical protein
MLVDMIVVFALSFWSLWFTYIATLPTQVKIEKKDDI